MRGIAAFICFAGILALATASPLCDKAEDCGDGECCVALTAATAERKGFCLKLRRERQRCSKEESKLSEFYGGKFLRFCPCQQNLECTERGSTKIYFCQKGSGTTKTPEGTEPATTDGGGEDGNDATTPAPTTPEPTTPEPDEGFGDNDDETPEEEAQGPGGEKPRDDDCEDWELPC